MNGLQRKTLRGEPLVVGDREIIPEARVWSLEFKQATVGGNHVSGAGMHWFWARPTAVIDRLNGKERSIPIADWNLRLEITLLIAAIILPLLLTLATALARHLPARRE